MAYNVNPNSTKWIPPLPPGWEGRWDANQRAYFFIDHSTKKTTWQDPRFNPQVTNQPAFPPQKNQLQPEKMPMPGLSPEPTFVDDTMAENIHKDYPRVPLDTIKDIVSACNFNEEESRVMLTRMGYQKGPAESPHRTTDTPSKPKSAGKGKAKAKSPSRSPARSPSPSPAPAPAPPVSEAEKKRITSKLKSEFSNLDNMVVTMALDVCEFREEQTRILLKSWDEDKNKGNKAHSRPKSSTSTTTSFASTSLDPVSLDNDDPPRPSSSKRTTVKASQPKSTKSVVTSHPGQRRTKQPTQVTHRQPTQRQQVITHQPRTESANRTQSTGPNPDLRMGPDKSLLLSDYTLVRGPNLANRQGPDLSRVVGAQGATGPDPANRCGPQSLGHIQQANRQQLLVTNI